METGPSIVPFSTLRFRKLFAWDKNVVPAPWSTTRFHSSLCSSSFVKWCPVGSVGECLSSCRLAQSDKCKFHIFLCLNDFGGWVLQWCSKSFLRRWCEPHISWCCKGYALDSSLEAPVKRDPPFGSFRRFVMRSWLDILHEELDLGPLLKTRFQKSKAWQQQQVYIYTVHIDPEAMWGSSS